MKTQLLALGMLLLIQACSMLKGPRDEDPVARVLDHYLYPSDLRKAIPEGSNQEDSAFLAKRYIEAWIKDQLLLDRARQSLSEEQMDFEQQIEEYHRSLLIYTYRQELLQQKLDSVVSEEDIRAYYEENQGNFLLSEDVIRGSFVKVPLSAPNLAELRQWSWSNREEDLDQMEKYCLTHGGKYNDFTERWIYFSSISTQLPISIPDPGRYLNNRRNSESRDSAYRYLLHISDHLGEGEATPLELIEEDIKTILLNKRKIEFIRDLEHRVYNDGLTRNQFEIYH